MTNVALFYAGHLHLRLVYFLGLRCQIANFPSHAVTLPRPCHALDKSHSERRIRGMAGERRGMCELNTAALFKSNGKDTIYSLSRTAWQGNGMVCVNPP
jgi:hypothetical protein